MNELKIDGNLGRDPSVFTTSTGKPMVSCSIAHNEEYNGVKKTMWVSLTCFGEAAEKVGQLKKGAKVSLIGKLDTTKAYTKKDGTAVPEGLGMVAFKLSDDQPKQSAASEPAPASNTGNFFEDEIGF